MPASLSAFARPPDMCPTETQRLRFVCLATSRAPARIFSKSRFESPWPCVTMQKRWAPAASAACACSRICSGSIIACIGVSASAYRDWAQKPQSSAQPPDFAFTSEHMSVASAKRSVRTAQARSTMSQIPSWSVVAASSSASSKVKSGGIRGESRCEIGRLPVPKGRSGAATLRRMTRRLTRLADIAYRRRGTVVLAWIGALVVLIGLGTALAGEYNADYDTPGSEAAGNLTQREFGGYSGQEVYVVWKDEAGAATPATAQRVNAFLDEAAQVEHVDPHTPIRVSDDGTIATTTLPLTVPGWEMEKEQGEQLIDAAEANSGDGLEIKLGGDPIYQAQSQSSPEGLGFLGAAIVLLIAFGSVVAAGLPLTIALVGLGISSGGLILLLANVVDVPDWTTAVSGLIGIGVGIDYALLVLTRFRAAMNDGKDRHDAVVEAVTTAGRSVIIAGCTVVIAVLGLMLTGLPYMYGVAISASIAVLVVMLAAVTLLPALLSYLGPRVDRLRIPFLGRTLRSEGDSNSPAARWSHAVQRRPWIAAIAATAALLALAAPALGMRLGFPDAGNDPPDTMTRQAYDLISEGFGPGSNGPLVIAAELPDQGAGEEIESLAARVRSDEGVAFVPDPVFSEDGTAAIVNVIPTT